jgi:hypothetical protein
MAAKYGRFGTGIENWDEADKDLWLHKNNTHMFVNIHKAPYSYEKNPRKYLIEHTVYVRDGYQKGQIVRSNKYDYADTIADARKIAKKYLIKYNNVLEW